MIKKLIYLSLFINVVLLGLLIWSYTEKTYWFSYDQLNEAYDNQALDIIRALGDEANCIDIGAHTGHFTRLFLKHCPKGQHFAIEPLPHLYEKLQDEFGNQVSVFPQALSNERGKTTFNYIVSNAGYSGIKHRATKNADEEVKEIEVDLELLDNLIQPEQTIDFIKIDVEGAEFMVMQGAKRILEQYKPKIIFEFGYTSRDLYGAHPEEVYDFLDSLGYELTLMEYHLRGAPAFTRTGFIEHFNQGYNWYFLAKAKRS